MYSGSNSSDAAQPITDLVYGRSFMWVVSPTGSDEFDHFLRCIFASHHLLNIYCSCWLLQGTDLQKIARGGASCMTIHFAAACFTHASRRDDGRSCWYIKAVCIPRTDYGSVTVSQKIARDQESGEVLTFLWHIAFTQCFQCPHMYVRMHGCR